MPRRKGSTSSKKRKKLANDDSPTSTPTAKSAKNRVSRVAVQTKTATSPWSKCEEALNLCNELLRDMISRKYSEFAWPFYKPIDAALLGMHDYLYVIDRPMSLGTIRYKMEHQKYICPQEFADDVRLIFANCYKYYRPEHDIFGFAQRLQELFEKRYAKINDTSVMTVNDTVLAAVSSSEEHTESDDEHKQLHERLTLLTTKCQRIEHELVSLIKHQKETREAKWQFQPPEFTNDVGYVAGSIIYIPATCLKQLTGIKPPLSGMPQTLCPGELQGTQMLMPCDNNNTNTTAEELLLPPPLPPSLPLLAPMPLSVSRGRGGTRGRGRGRGTRGGALVNRKAYALALGRGKGYDECDESSAPMSLHEIQDLAKQLRTMPRDKIIEIAHIVNTLEPQPNANNKGDCSYDFDLMKPSTLHYLKSFMDNVQADPNFIKRTATKVKSDEVATSIMPNVNEQVLRVDKKPINKMLQIQDTTQLMHKVKNLSETSSSEKSLLISPPTPTSLSSSPSTSPTSTSSSSTITKRSSLSISNANDVGDDHDDDDDDHSSLGDSPSIELYH